MPGISIVLLVTPRPCMDRILSKFLGCLTGVAVGDSLGAQGEGSAETTREAAALSPRYTDDTVMTIGVADSLVDQKAFHYWHMAERLVKDYEREPWRRYSATATRVFRMMRHGRKGFGMLDRDIYPEGSFGNSAATRVSPVGLLYHDDPRSLRDVAYHCASITHSHDLALEGAVLQACAVALAVHANPDDVNAVEFLGTLSTFTRSAPYQEKFNCMIRFLERGASRGAVIEQLGNGGGALNSVPTAIYAFLANPGFAAPLLFAVSLGGDAEAIGSLTGAIAGACYGMESIPVRWRETVENRDLIKRLGKDLWQVKQQINREAVGKAFREASSDVS
jgi:poly(ADP-ribose) glycohydrolase ARH3